MPFGARSMRHPSSVCTRWNASEIGLPSAGVYSPVSETKASAVTRWVISTESDPCDGVGDGDEGAAAEGHVGGRVGGHVVQMDQQAPEIDQQAACEGGPGQDEHQREGAEHQEGVDLLAGGDVAAPRRDE